jgi:hypothetical protein
MSTFEGSRGNTLPLVQDNRVKAGCCTFDISSDGEVLATKHPSGYLIPYMQGCRTSRVQFMSCTNVIKTPSWPYVFASVEEDFGNMQVGSLPNVFMIMVQGLTSINGNSHVVYHRWKGKGCVSNIHLAIDQYKKDPSGFARLTFHSRPECTATKEIWLHFASPLQGNSFDHWPSASTVNKGGKMYYCSADQPISMCTQDPFPSQAKIYNLYQLPSGFSKIDGYETKRNRKNMDNKAAGTPSLFNITDSTTTVIYSRSAADVASLQLQPILESKVFWQPLHTPSRPDLVYFVSLSVSQFDKLEKYMKRSGPIPGAKFNNKAIGLSREEKGQIISMRRLTFDKVS